MAYEDIAPVAALEQSIFTDPWNEREISSAIAQEGNLFFVAQGKDGTIVGYCGSYISSDEGMVTNVAVAAGSRRRGIASVLLETLICEAWRAGVQKIFLEVRASNAAAQGLYRKFGFEVCGVRRGYYRYPREDALVMVCHPE